MGDAVAALLAGAWCDRLQGLYDIWCVEKLPTYVYSEADLTATAMPPDKRTEIVAAARPGSEAAVQEYLGAIEGMRVSTPRE